MASGALYRQHQIEQGKEISPKSHRLAVPRPARLREASSVAASLPLPSPGIVMWMREPDDKTTDPLPCLSFDRRIRERCARHPPPSGAARWEVLDDPLLWGFSPTPPDSPCSSSFTNHTIKVPDPLSSIRLSFTDLERSSLLQRPHCPACISHIHPYMDQLVSCLLRSALAVN
jgi:hypothetical protein